MRVFFLLLLVFAPFAFSVKIFEEAGVEAYLEEARVPNPSSGQDTVYFVMEKMPENEAEQDCWLSFWANYTRQDKQVFLDAPYEFALKSNLPRGAYYAGHSSFELFFEDFSDKKNYNEARTQGNEFWVSYITPEKPTQPAFKSQDSFKAEMTMGVLTHPGSPVVMHMGFQRSFQYSRDNGVNHKGLCVPLNGFVASVLRENNPDKTYMITAPTPKLHDIFMKTPDLKGGVWDGLNQTSLQFENEEIQTKWEEIETGFQNVRMDLDVLASMEFLPNYTQEGEEKAFELEKKKFNALKGRIGRRKKEAITKFSEQYQQDYDALASMVLEEGREGSRHQKIEGLKSKLEELFLEKKRFLEKEKSSLLKEQEAGEFSPFLKDDDESILIGPDGRHLLVYTNWEQKLDSAFVCLPGQEPPLIEGKEALNDFSYFSKAVRGRGQKTGSLLHCYGCKHLTVSYEKLAHVFLNFQENNEEG